MCNTLRRRARAFLSGSDGVVSVETVIMFPLLLWGFGAMFVFWDAFKSQNINLKASYTIADMISREDDPITPAFITGMNQVYQFLIGRDDGNDVRVTVVSQGLDTDGVTPVKNLEWSHATGLMQPFTEVGLLEDNLPIMSVGDQLIVVETQMTWIPVLSYGLSERQMTQMIFTSPRFVPQVLFDDT